MVRVTKLTDYGIALMVRLAEEENGGQLTAQDLSEAMSIPLPTVRKLLKTLARDGLLESTRGASGGYRLARAPEQVTLMEMVTALEGPVAMTECSTGGGCDCALERVCGLKENWSWINQQFKNTLQNYSLAQMAGSLADAGPAPLQNLETDAAKSLAQRG